MLRSMLSRWRTVERVYLLEGALVALLILGPALGIAVALDADSGSIAEWVAATATVAAFIAAVYAGVQAGRVVQLERARVDYRDRREQSAQAVLVAAWGGDIITTAKHTIVVSGPGSSQHAEVGPTIPARFQVTMRNASRLPVFETWLQVYFGHPDGRSAGDWQLVAEHRVGTLLPEVDLEVDLVGARAIGLAEQWFGDPASPVYQAMAAEFATRGTPFDAPPEMAVGWSLRDVSGLHWVHRPGGQLTQETRPAAPAR